MNIKISIANIIISFCFDDEKFLHIIQKDFKNFILKTQKEDISVKLVKVSDYEMIDGKWNYFFVTKQEQKYFIKKWDINGYLEDKNGYFEIHEDVLNFHQLLKFILNISLPNYEGLMLHASTSVNSFGAIIAAGISGSGKSTFAKKLKKETAMFEDNEKYEIIHDEITILRKEGSCFWAYPSPFNHNPKHIVNYSEPKKVKYLLFLKRNDEKTSKISKLRYYKEIFKVIFSYDTNSLSQYEHFFNNIEKLYLSTNIMIFNYSLDDCLVEKIKDLC